MHASNQIELERIDELIGCTEGSPEERELNLWPRSPTASSMSVTPLLDGQ